MKYTIAKMFQILRHNRWVSILMIIEIALGMSVFTYSLNMFFSLSREKENQKNQERDLVLEISGGEGMNDIEKQAFTLKDYEKVDEITDGQTFLYVVLPQFYSYKNENYEFVMILVDYKKLDLKNGYYLKKAGHSVSAICRRYVRILEKLLDQDDEFKLKYNNIRDEKTNLTCDI